jgi:integrase
MAFKMPKLERSRTGAYAARKVVPEDVRDEYQRLFGKRREERFHASAATPHEKAKAAFGKWLAEVEGRIAAIRGAQRGEGRTLTFKDAQALAGEWYRWYVEQREDNPGQAAKWAHLEEVLTDEIWRLAPDWFKEDSSRDTDWAWAREHGALAELRPMVADYSQMAQFLAGRGLVLSNEAREQFLDALVDELLAAFRVLERRARGDYSADDRLQHFPTFEPDKSPGTTGKNCWQLFESWVAAAQPQESTVNRWRAVFTHLDKHFAGRAAGTLTEDETQNWAIVLVTSKRGARTVSDIWVTAARSVFAWAHTQRLIRNNPFADTSVTVPKQIRTREKEFTTREIETILKSTLAVTDTRRPFKAACRWVPWLCAYSGSRAGEITQLRGQDVQTRDSIVVLRLTPEAGTIKTSAPRTVPLHEHIVAQGFLDYVKTKGQGPLFYVPEDTPKTAADPMNPRRARAVKTRERLAEWVRSLGVTDPEISPNHAWRHTFKRRAARAKIEKRIRDAFCGHSTRDVGDQYETPTPEDMADALRQFPRYPIDGPQEAPEMAKIGMSGKDAEDARGGNDGRTVHDGTFQLRPSASEDANSK